MDDGRFRARHSVTHNWVDGETFCARYLATLFGLTLFTHQIGGFLGAWLGGLAVLHMGNYDWIWWADAAVA